MHTEVEVIVVGAGAAGLICAYELALLGKGVVVLEARDRVGGRIWPVRESFGRLGHGGAEFVHGPAPVTHALAREAGLTILPLAAQVQRPGVDGFVIDEGLTLYQEVLNQQLGRLEEDIPVAAFLEKYFGGPEYEALRSYVHDLVEEYDAADPQRMSTFSLRKEWLGGIEWEQGKIKEGYGALLDFLVKQCKKRGVEFRFNHKVVAVTVEADGVMIDCDNDQRLRAMQAVLTLPLPVLARIRFTPELPKKMEAISQIGFGGVIKILLLFQDRWWGQMVGVDPSKAVFTVAPETITTWWDQTPDPTPLLVGWVAGPAAEKLKEYSDELIIDRALASAEAIFNISRNVLREKLVRAEVFNWFTDPFAEGAYSYPTTETDQALSELLEPVEDRLFFAGEALYRGQETATVEGALASGQETAHRLVMVAKRRAN